MKTKKKEITVYVSDDNKEFMSEMECKEWDKHLVLDKLHKKLIECNFHSRCKIRPYFHNKDRVRYKLRGSTIVMLKYSTDSDEQEFLCSIPSNWINLNIEDLKIEVNKFIKNRKVYQKVVNTTSTVSHIEV